MLAKSSLFGSKKALKADAVVLESSELPLSVLPGIFAFNSLLLQPLISIAMIERLNKVFFMGLSFHKEGQVFLAQILARYGKAKVSQIIILLFSQKPFK
jgi:hypothetical protein